MSVTADQERRFYDQNYAPHLNAADGALRVDRAILAAQFDDPASTTTSAGCSIAPPWRNCWRSR
jgi:hypothetical protein